MCIRDRVKFVPDDQYLVKRVQVNVDNPKLDKVDVKSYVRQKGNYKILGFIKFHLFLYNLSSKKKTEGWFKRIGEPPQVYDEILTEKSESQLKQYAYSKGYYRASVFSSVTFKEKKKKAIV